MTRRLCLPMQQCWLPLSVRAPPPPPPCRHRLAMQASSRRWLTSRSSAPCCLQSRHEGGASHALQRLASLCGSPQRTLTHRPAVLQASGLGPTLAGSGRKVTLLAATSELGGSGAVGGARPAGVRCDALRPVCPPSPPHRLSRFNRRSSPASSLASSPRSSLPPQQPPRTHPPCLSHLGCRSVLF